MKDYTNSEIAAVIDDVVHSARDRAILKRRYIDGITFERLGEEFELSTQRVKTIAYKGMEKLSKYL